MVRFLRVVSPIMALGFMLFIAGCGKTSSEGLRAEEWTAERLANNPIISLDTKGNTLDWGIANVNGPSVIEVPSWVQYPLGKYYMYFAHHRGSYIRLAVADSVAGPWKIIPGGVLHLMDTPALDHIASPDVLVDNENQVIRMFYHSPDDTTTWNQNTYLATSTDGLTFTSQDDIIGPPYLRAFQIEDQWWAISKVRGGPGAILLKSDSPDGPFEEGPTFVEGMRHGTVRVEGENVELIFTRIGDSPERILKTYFNPVEMWSDPYPLEILEVLQPETEYEGALLPATSSEVGEVVGPVNALRDPYYFMDSSGQAYLFYSVAGESGIAVARVVQ